jgi:hypothetical protein
MECQLRPLVYSLGLNNLPHQGFTAGKSCVEKLWCNKQGSCRCKMAGTGIQSFAKFHAQILPRNAKGLRRLRGLWHSAENLWAEPFGLWHSGVKFYQGVGIPQYIGEWCRWHSAVCLRAVCQEVIPVVAIRGIWPRNLANDRIPAPAILHRQFPCLLRHKFLLRDFLGVRHIRGGLFRPKLYTNGLSWQTISWYYPFNCVHSDFLF